MLIFITESYFKTSPALGSLVDDNDRKTVVTKHLSPSFPSTPDTQSEPPSHLPLYHFPFVAQIKVCNEKREEKRSVCWGGGWG